MIIDRPLFHWKDLEVAVKDMFNDLGCNSHDER